MDSALILPAGLFLAGLVGGDLARFFIAAHKANSVEQQLKTKIEGAKQEAREILLEAKDKAAYALEEAKTEERSHKGQMARF